MKIFLLLLFLCAACSSSHNMEWSPRDNRAIREILNDHIHEFKRCFPGDIPRGTTVMAYFEIYPDGRVNEAKIDSEQHWQTNRCIGSIIRDIEFPETDMDGIFRVKQKLYFR